MRLSELLILVFVAGCPSPPPPSGPTEPLGGPAPTPTLPPPSGIADGQSCTDNNQCASGVCEGQGCTDQQPGICASQMRACTKDLRPYCGCDGVTFATSGSCPGRRYASKGECSPPPSPPQAPQPQVGRADGQSCTASSQCTSGVCEGEGCSDDKPGTCAPQARACTRDLRPYCGCDGVTFKTSGSCPGRRYAHKGAC